MRDRIVEYAAAATMSWIVNGKRSRTIGMAGWPRNRSESPKSPRIAPPRGRILALMTPVPEISTPMLCPPWAEAVKASPTKKRYSWTGHGLSRPYRCRIAAMASSDAPGGMSIAAGSPVRLMMTNTTSRTPTTTKIDWTRRERTNRVTRSGSTPDGRPGRAGRAVGSARPAGRRGGRPAISRGAGLHLLGPDHLVGPRLPVHPVAHAVHVHDLHSGNRVGALPHHLLDLGVDGLAPVLVEDPASLVDQLVERRVVRIVGRRRGL